MIQQIHDDVKKHRKQLRHLSSDIKHTETTISYETESKVLNWENFNNIMKMIFTKELKSYNTGL